MKIYFLQCFAERHVIIKLTGFSACSNFDQFTYEWVDFPPFNVQNSSYFIYQQTRKINYTCNFTFSNFRVYFSFDSIHFTISLIFYICLCSFSPSRIVMNEAKNRCWCFVKPWHQTEHVRSRCAESQGE